MAKSWGISERSVRNYCAHGRVPGAVLSGKKWLVPADATMPKRLNARARSATDALLDRLRQEQEARIHGGIYHKLQVEMTYNSNRMEGSRLTEEQTRLIFETATVGVGDESVRVDDIVETTNHFRAIDCILRNVEKPLSEAMLKRLHAILKTGTSDADLDWFEVGEYKRIPNEVGGRPTAAPEDVPAQVKALLKEYGRGSNHSFEDIVGFHVRFERIHPFQDGNGRVGRLVLLKECLANGIVPFVLTDALKGCYYRGLSEWDDECGFLLDTCLTAQDAFKEWMEYFRIEGE